MNCPRCGSPLVVLSSDAIVECPRCELVKCAAILRERDEFRARYNREPGSEFDHLYIDLGGEA